MMTSCLSCLHSAPTGSGKTTVFELAFLRMHSQGYSEKALAIYMAPTKALCAERANDWMSRFANLGVTCKSRGTAG